VNGFEFRYFTHTYTTKGGKTEEFVRNVLQEAEHFREIIRVGEQQPRG